MDRTIKYEKHFIYYLAKCGFKSDGKFHLVCWRQKNRHVQKRALVFKHHNWIFKDEVVYMLANCEIQIHGTNPRNIGLNTSILNMFTDAINYAERWLHNPDSRLLKYDTKVVA